MAERADTALSKRELGVTVGAACTFEGLDDEAEAWRRAREIEKKVADVMAEYGVSKRRPLVNVWTTGGGPILD